MEQKGPVRHLAAYIFPAIVTNEEPESGSGGHSHVPKADGVKQEELVEAVAGSAFAPAVVAIWVSVTRAARIAGREAVIVGEVCVDLKAVS